jgi:hypothetical protein
MMEMGPVTVDNMRGSCRARGEEVPERGQRILVSQGPIDESLPEWFNLLVPAEDSTGR